MTDTLCAVCEKRPTPDGYACQGCASRASGHLAAIIELTGDARLVAAGLVRRGDGAGGGKPASRPPLNDGATDAVDAIQNAMTTLARDVAETRGLRVDWKGRSLVDPLVGASSWLLGQIEWLRHAVDDQGQPYAVTAFDEIAVAAGRLRGLVNGPSEQRYLGPCGSTVEWDDDGNEVERDEPCAGDVFAPLGGDKGTCRTCKARWATEQRQAWLDGQVRSHAFRATHIADAYGVNVNTIRSWAARGQLVTHGSQLDVKTGKQAPLYNVGEVLDLAAADAARRAGEQAKRARRAANRAAEESEDAA